MSSLDATRRCRLKPARADRLRLVQITDCHLFATEDGLLGGINTLASLRAICGRIARRETGVDAILATGDLSQDGSTESYRLLAREFETLQLPVFCIPGNHDDAGAMDASLKGQNIRSERSISAGEWQILLLDSTVPGEVHGHVDEGELAAMRSALANSSEAHVLIGLHHQAQDVGSRWIDAKGLPRNAELRAEIARHDRVRAVVWGHVHQEFRLRSGGIDWLATPSTCVQFAPASVDFATDALPPGYRVLDLLADGRVETRVERLPAEASAGPKPRS